MECMTRHALLCALSLTVFGCSRSEEPPAPVQAVDTAPTDPAARAARPKTVDEAVELYAAGEYDPTEPEADAPPDQRRDLATELLEALGNPADCLKDYRPSSPTTMRIRIAAVVRPSGLIIEPQARARGLSENDRRCIEERMGAVTLKPLEGSMSQIVATLLEIEYEPPAVESYDVAPPPPPPNDVVQALPKKRPIAPSGVPIEGPEADPIEGPSGQPIEGPEAKPIEGPKPVPIGSD
jgi:hypothetical protein